MPLVDARDLVKRFADLVAVDGVSLAVDRGEVVGFLGPNGAGKSTTMKMIAGFLEPDSGGATIAGHDVSSEPLAAKQRIGYLPEGAPAYGDMAVGSFLTFVGRMRGLSGRALQARLGAMAEQVNLASVWNRPIEALSKGFKRRVGIAQALIHDPDVLILDEPTDGLDPNQKHDMRSLIRGIAAEKAIIISTHILEEVEAVCSRAVIIARGRVLADSTPLELVASAADHTVLKVTVADAAAEQVADAVRPLVNGAQMTAASGLNGTTVLRIARPGTEAEPLDLARDLAAKGLAIEAIERDRPRLEDVFRAITTASVN